MLSTIVTIQRAVLFITTAASDTASRCVAGPLLFGRYPSEDPYGLCTEQTEYTTFYDGHATEAGPIISYVRYRTWLYVLIYMQIYLSCIYLVRYIPVYTYYKYNIKFLYEIKWLERSVKVRTIIALKVSSAATRP